MPSIQTSTQINPAHAVESKVLRSMALDDARGATSSAEVLLLLMRIVVVDDNALSRAIAEDALTECGFDAVAVESAEALEQLLTTGDIPDLILLDVVLEGADGVAVCRHLKADARYGCLPVVFLSSQPDDVMQQLTGAAGADGYMTKARVTDQSLAEEIRSFVSEVQGESNRTP